MHDILNKIFINPSESLSIFTDNELASLDFYEKETGSNKWFLKSFSKGEEEKQVYSDKKSAPEEIVRQLFLYRLINKYKYPKELVNVEVIVNFGREKKRADIIVYKDDRVTPYILVEVKAPNEKNDAKQLKSYLNAEGAEIGVTVNGLTQEVLYRPYPKDFSVLPNIPEYGQDPDDVFNQQFTYAQLKDPKQLKQTIQNLEDLVLVNSGFDSFDEIFKLIYAKIYDEIQGRDNPDYVLEFRSHKNVETTQKAIGKLFDHAKDEWKDIFEDSDKIKLKDTHLNHIVAELQEWRLMGANLQVIDDAFEYLIPDVAKGKKGQYFTPRHVIDMCVKMMNPKRDEYVIDTACGSGGFLIHTMNYVRDANHLTSAMVKDYSGKRLWGVDFDEKSSKISKAMMLIAGDGRSHIFKENSLDSDSWTPGIKYSLDTERLANKDYSKFNFDILLANPPFAGEVNDKHILAQFPNVVKEKQDKISRHLLFIERNLNFVKDGGRLAMVLPQGVFNNTSEKYIRDFITDRARILAVVGLEANTFKPHTGTKTSVIFLQKWDAVKCQRVNDYPIFFATSEKSGKDNSGQYIKDTEGNLIDDLDDIAIAFIEFAKREKFNFWN